MRSIAFAGALLVAQVASAGPMILPGPAGSTVLLLEDATLPLVSVEVVLRTGAQDVEQGKEGLASFVARLPFRGFGRARFHALGERFRAHGAEARMDVDYQRVSFGTTALRDQIDSAVGLLAEVLLRPELRIGERDVLDFSRWSEMKEEALRVGLRTKLTEDGEDTGERLQRCLRRALYGSHPLGSPVDGTIQSLDGLSLEEAVRAYQRALVGINLVFAIAGPLSPREAVALLARHFGRLPAGPPIGSPARLPPAPRGMRVHLVEAQESEKIEIALGQRAPLPGAPGFAALKLVVGALGGPKGSRFQRERWPDPERPAQAWLGAGEAAGLFSVQASADRDNLVEVLDGLLARVEGWAKGGPAPDEIDAARRYFGGAQSLWRQTPAERLREHLLRALVGAGPGGPEDEAEGLRRPGWLPSLLRAYVRPRDLQICIAGDRDDIRDLLKRSRTWGARVVEGAGG